MKYILCFILLLFGSPVFSLNQPNIQNDSHPIEKKTPYLSFSIESPLDQETIQNQPNITVKLSIKPDLQENDKIQIYLDGKPWGLAQASTQIDLGRLERGMHQLHAEIIDKEMRFLRKSAVITIYVHYAHR